MKTINCFGCSFTQGVCKNLHTWPKALAEKLPSYKIVNYGSGGTSVLWSIYLMEKFSKPDDISIFQVTNPRRFTFWKDQLKVKKFLKQVTENYWAFDVDIQNYYTQINTGILDDLSHKNYELARKIYLNANKKYFQTSYRAEVDYASRLADFVFAHQNFHYTWLPESQNLISYQEQLSSKEWKDSAIDSGGHFSKEASIKQSEWIYKQLLEKELINV